MSEKIEVCKTGELQDGVIKEVQAEDNKVLVVRVGKDYYAADARCPHMQADLSESKLDGTVITCPLHGSRFDLKDGSVVSWLGMTGVALKAAGAIHVPKKIAVYKVEIDGDRVLIDI